MSDEIEFLYYMRLRGRSSSADIDTRLASALLNDFTRNEEKVEDVVPNESDEEAEADCDRDVTHVPKDEASDAEDDVVIEPTEIFDSDDDDDEDEDETLATDESFFGKDGTEWKREPSPSRAGQPNIKPFRGGGGPKLQTSIPIEVFESFFTPNISSIIITETNRFAKRATSKWNKENPESQPRGWVDLTRTELNAFIGILLASGVSRTTMHDCESLWRSDSLPIFRAAMSHRRFLALTRYLRFDNSRTRPSRQATDKAAPIRVIWNILNENLARNYEPHENVTMDEQLFPYRGRTKFTQFIPSKAGKYGIRVWWALDSKTKYPLQGKLYTGKEDNETGASGQGENVLIELSEQYRNSGRTIVADHFFTTLDGAKRLAAGLGLNFVGRMRGNNACCLPPEMKKSPQRPVLSSRFGFHDHLISLSSYVPKRMEAVNLLSTLHYSKNCEGVAQRPEALVFFNINKCGVDSMDRMASEFTTKRPTKRWTVAFFYNILDVMALAAYIVCREKDAPYQQNTRRAFLNSLAKTLVASNIEDRMNNPKVMARFSTRAAIESFFGKAINIPPNLLTAHRSGPETLTSKKNCRLCLQAGDKLRRKTRFFCSVCSDPVCQKHSKIEYTCFACLPENP